MNLFWYCFLHQCDHIRGENTMPMVLFVGPCRLSTRQSLTISGYKACRPVRESAKSLKPEIKKLNGHIPSNLFKRDVIKTPQHFCLHLQKGPRTASNAKLKLCCSPVLLN